MTDAGAGRPVVSFVIPVRNDAARLRRCLRSIKANRYPAELIEVVVADNGSTDDSAPAARSEGATVLSLPGVRLGELRNRAVAASRGEILAFVDADHEIVPDWVPSAVSLLSDPRVAGAGAACVPPSPGTWVQQSYDGLRRHPEGQEETEWLGSGNMAVSRAAFNRVGGFDTSLETCEDVDLCRKLRSGGAILMADSRMRNIHYGDPETLGRVFFGELWRGRDNLRVSLRPPRAWRTVASAVIPLVNLLLLAIIVAGLVSARWSGLAAAAAAALCVLALVGLRAARMLTGSSRGVSGAVAVAAAYELGRALAPAARLRYGRRREGAVA